jgi:hypothetical protein
MCVCVCVCCPMAGFKHLGRYDSPLQLSSNVENTSAHFRHLDGGDAHTVLFFIFYFLFFIFYFFNFCSKKIDIYVLIFFFR